MDRFSAKHTGGRGYILHVGEIPDGMVVMHACDNPRCVNPSHLKLGTYQENALDCVAKGRHQHTVKTHCPKGHEYTPENTYHNKSKGCRQCRQCQREYMRKKMGYKPRHSNTSQTTP